MVWLVVPWHFNRFHYINVKILSVGDQLFQWDEFLDFEAVEGSNIDEINDTKEN